MFNKGQRGDLATTDETLRPGDFAIGSLESGAAARARVQQRRSARQRDGLDLVVGMIGDRFFGPNHKLGIWQDQGDGTRVRVSYLPSGLSIEEADEIAARVGRHNIGKEWNMRNMLHNQVP